MCGIVGMAGDLNATHEKAMKTLLILDALRGVDSTGVVYIGKSSNDVKLAKQIGVPYELFDHKSFEKATSGLQKVMIGHNRAATSGAITRQNAHPFDLGPIVGVHNGVVRNKHVLADAGDFRVDSENLYHHILKHGIEDALSKIDAAYALVWWDKKEETINFLRNKDRPLYWASSVDTKGEIDGKCIFWASEAWMLNVALSRENIAISKPEMLTVDMHFSMKVENGGKLGKAVAKKAEHTFRPATSSYGYQGNNYHYSRYDEYNERQAQHQQSAAQTQSQGTQTPPAAAATPSSTNNVIPLTGPKKVEEDEGKAFDRFYIKRKNVLYEVMEACTDQDNVVFLPCFDPKSPSRIFVSTLKTMKVLCGNSKEVKSKLMWMGLFQLLDSRMAITN
jgi:glucosamine 6-phosphate synthetase-like amidotransferase/phosphosugar isomerase protein